MKINAMAGLLIGLTVVNGAFGQSLFEKAAKGSEGWTHGNSFRSDKVRGMVQVWSKHRRKWESTAATSDDFCELRFGKYAKTGRSYPSGMAHVVSLSLRTEITQYDSFSDSRADFTAAGFSQSYPFSYISWKGSLQGAGGSFGTQARSWYDAAANILSVIVTTVERTNPLSDWISGGNVVVRRYSVELTPDKSGVASLRFTSESNGEPKDVIDCDDFHPIR